MLALAISIASISARQMLRSQSGPKEKWFTSSGYQYYIRARMRFLEVGLGASVAGR